MYCTYYYSMCIQFMRAYFSFGDRAGVEVVIVIAMVFSAPWGSANTLRMATSIFYALFLSFLPWRTTAAAPCLSFPSVRTQ
jgi:hypothetical protein